jgi:hypothetical protein
VDVEMSFARPETIFATIEPLMHEIFAVIGRTIATPFLRMSYDDAMAQYGSDKPDLRCGMPIQDIREAFRETPFRVFREIVAGGGTVRGFVIKNAGGYSRSEVDGIVDQAKQMGAAGLIWARRAEDGTITSSIMKALGEDGVRQMLDAASCGQRRDPAGGRGGARSDVEAPRSAAAEPGEAEGPSQSRRVCVPVGGGLSALDWDRRLVASLRCTTRSPRLVTRTWRCSTPIRAGAGKGLRPRAQRQ